MRRRYLFCGGRDFSDDRLVWKVLPEILPRDAIVVTGYARGLDTLVNNVCHSLNRSRKLNLWVVACPADWTELGNVAGPVRNKEMLDEFQPDVVVAFPGGPGTQDMVSKALATGCEVLSVDAMGNVTTLQKSP